MIVYRFADTVVDSGNGLLYWKHNTSLEKRVSLPPDPHNSLSVNCPGLEFEWLGSHWYSVIFKLLFSFLILQFCTEQHCCYVQILIMHNDIFDGLPKISIILVDCFPLCLCMMKIILNGSKLFLEWCSHRFMYKQWPTFEDMTNQWRQKGVG